MGAPTEYEQLRSELAAKHGTLSKRLRQIAEYALENPNDMALETVSGIAERADVQPSSLIRFAKAFGYNGFSEMQRVFRTQLLEQASDYKDRIRSLGSEPLNGRDGGDSILGDFARAGIAALEQLQTGFNPNLFDAAVRQLNDCDTIYITGQRRSFPVASYLAYALAKLGKRCIHADGIGGMLNEQIASMRERDLLLAISFKSYAPETVQAVQDAVANGIPVMAITDGPLSPLVPHATLTLEVEEAEAHSFRALNATMTLALALVVGLGRIRENP